MKKLLVTGSSGLIGSEVCTYFARELGFTVHGVDNNQRDIRGIVVRQGIEKIDLQLIQKELKPLCEAKENLEIMDRLDAMCRK